MSPEISALRSITPVELTWRILFRFRQGYLNFLNSLQQFTNFCRNRAHVFDDLLLYSRRRLLSSSSHACSPFAGDSITRSNVLISSSFSPSGLFAPARFVSVLLPIISCDWYAWRQVSRPFQTRRLNAQLSLTPSLVCGAASEVLFQVWSLSPHCLLSVTKSGA